MILAGRSFGLTDATGNTYGFPRVIVYSADGKIKFPTGGGPGGTYTVSNGLTESPPNNFQLGGTLAADTTILGNSNLYDLSFTSLYSSTIGASQKIFFEANDGTINTFLHLNPQSSYTKWTYDDGTNLNEIEMTGARMYIRTPDYTTASNGDVLTLLDNTTGEVEFQTPTGGGGLLYGITSGTNAYTVTIAGVTGYADGDTYVIKFTNGNDADSTININGLGVKTLVKEFNVQITGGDIVSGQELIIIYDGTNFQTLGVAPNQLFAYVTNDDTVTITKGQAVYAAGAAGNRMSVKLAYNTSDATSAQTVGVVFSSSIAANQRGFIITQGVISGVNTAAYNPGDQLYLGATAGSLTKIKPYAPNHLVYIGIVERANAGNGQIYIKPQNGYELDELHNVQAQSPTYKDTLWYDNTVSPAQWKTASIGTILGYTPVPSTRTLTIDGTSYDLSADRSWTTAGGSYAAYSMKANNTGAAAVPSDFTFKDLGDQAYTATIVWNGTAPTGPINLRYRWFQMGNIVQYFFYFTYTTQGVTNSSITFDFPSGMPAPTPITGTGAAGSFIYRNQALVYTAVTSPAPGTATPFWGGGIRRDAGNTKYEFFFTHGTAQTARAFYNSGFYFT